MGSNTTTTTAGIIVASCQGDFQRLIGVQNNQWVDWIDRVHQRILRHSRWRFQQTQVEAQQFYTTAGQVAYFLGSGTLPGSASITNVAIDATQNPPVATITAANNYVVGNGQTVVITGLTHTVLNNTWSLVQAFPGSFTFQMPAGTAGVASTPDTGTANTVFNTNLALADLDLIVDGTVLLRGIPGIPQGSVSQTVSNLAGGGLISTGGLGLYRVTTVPFDISGVWSLPSPPKAFLIRSNNVMELYPPPDNKYTVEFQYQASRAGITNFNSVLQVPDYYRAVVVAGVNELAAAYLAKDPSGARFAQEVVYWHDAFEDGLRSMIRDKQLFPRVSFIAPILP